MCLPTLYDSDLITDMTEELKSVYVLDFASLFCEGNTEGCEGEIQASCRTGVCDRFAFGCRWAVYCGHADIWNCGEAWVYGRRNMTAFHDSASCTVGSPSRGARWTSPRRLEVRDDFTVSLLLTENYTVIFSNDGTFRGARHRDYIEVLRH